MTSFIKFFSREQVLLGQRRRRRRGRGFGRGGLMKDMSFQWLSCKNWHASTRWSPGEDKKNVKSIITSALFRPDRPGPIIVIRKAWTPAVRGGSGLGLRVVLEKLIKVQSETWGGDETLSWGKLKERRIRFFFFLTVSTGRERGSRDLSPAGRLRDHSICCCFVVEIQDKVSNTRRRRSFDLEHAGTRSSPDSGPDSGPLTSCSRAGFIEFYGSKTMWEKKFGPTLKKAFNVKLRGKRSIFPHLLTWDVSPLIQVQSVLDGRRRR